MNFAVLGDDPAILSLARAVGSRAEHRLSQAAYVDRIVAELLEISPAIRVAEGWEQLLATGDTDAVIVSGCTPDVQEGAKQLASAGKAILLFPEVGQGLTLIYELGMIGEENQCVLWPAFPTRHHPSVQQARESMADDSFGEVLHLHLQRDLCLTDAAGGRRSLSARQTDELALGDIDLLRMLGGNYSQVTALWSANPPEDVSRASVNLAGENLPDASWTLDATAPETRSTLTVTGQHDSLTLRGGEDPTQLSLQPAGADTSSTERSPTEHSDGFRTGEVLLSQFESAVDRQPVASTWTDLTRAFEILDAAHRSVTRRRTIDLYFETTSERSIFKTQMTAVGCGLLSITLFAVVLLLFAAALLDPRGTREAQSEAADFIIYTDEFTPGSAELTEPGQRHVEEIIGPFSGGGLSTLIEQGATAELDEQRRKLVIDMLKSGGADDVALRTQVAALRGKWFLPLMAVARLAVFAPLLLYLLLQLLLFVARPASKQTTPASPGETS